MAWRLDDLDLQRSQRKPFAIAQQKVEVAAVHLEIVGAKHRPEDLLHLAYMNADADLRAGLRLEQGRCRQVIGMGMRFEDVRNAEPHRLSRVEHPLRRPRVDRAICRS